MFSYSRLTELSSPQRRATFDWGDESITGLVLNFLTLLNAVLDLIGHSNARQTADGRLDDVSQLVAAEVSERIPCTIGHKASGDWPMTLKIGFVEYERKDEK